jgi:DNA invertase Pin-like site-specific DNA recombinase
MLLGVKVGTGLSSTPISTPSKSVRSPTSWMLVGPADEFTARMFSALNSMMLDMLAAVARKEYDDRRRRQAEGIAKGKAAGMYRGRPKDSNRLAGIAAMLAGGSSWSTIQKATGCSRATVAKVARRAQASGETASALSTQPAIGFAKRISPQSPLAAGP